MDPHRTTAPRRSAWFIVVAALAVLGVAALVGARPAGDPSGLELGAASVSVSTVPTTSITTTTTTVPPPAVVPVPEPLPVSAFAETPEVVLGSIEIPALGIVEPLQEGMTLTAINRGPSHWPGTALPGRMGNVVVAGHRTTYSRPFERVDELVEGDLVHFELVDGTRATYEVRDVMIVPAEAIGIAAQDSAHTATLFACHPRGSATHRIVVKTRLLDEAGRPVDDEAILPPLEVGLRDQDLELQVRDTDEPLIVHDPFGLLVNSDEAQPIEAQPIAAR